MSDSSTYDDPFGFARGAGASSSLYHFTAPSSDIKQETGIGPSSSSAVGTVGQPTTSGEIRIWNQRQGSERELTVRAHLVLPLAFSDDPVAGSFSDQYAKVYASFLAQKREETFARQAGAMDSFESDFVDGGPILSDQHLELTDTPSAFVFRLIKTFLDDRVTILAFMQMRYRMMKVC